MRKRLLAAWMTYWSRPLVWLLGLLWIGLLVVPLMFGGSTSSSTSHPQVEMPQSSISKIERLDAVRQSGQQADVEGLRLDELWHQLVQRDAVWDEEQQSHQASGDPAEMDILKIVEEFPNLKALRYDNLILLPEDLERLSRCRQLTQLSLSGITMYEKASNPEAVGGRSWELSGDDLHNLSDLSELEVLDLSGIDFAGGMQHLSGLPKLHTLILSRFEHLNDAALADLRHLPHLQTLVIGPTYLEDGSGDPERVVTDAGLRTLAELPSLQTVILARRSFTVPVDTLRSILPNVRVRRGYYSQSRVMAGGPVLLFTCGMLALLLSLHTLSQYAQPAAYLLPRFSPAHQVMPVLFQGASIVGVTVRLVSEDAALLPSVGLAIVGLTAALWFFYGFSSHLPRSQGFSGAIERFTAVGLLMATVAAFMMFPVEFDSFLLGDTGWVISLALLIGGMIALVQWNRLLPHEAQRFAAAGTTAGLGWKDMNQVASKRQLRLMDTGGVPRLFRRSDRFLETAVRHASGGLWSQFQLWRAGVVRLGLSSAVMAVALGVFGISALLIRLYQSGSFGDGLMTRQNLIPSVMFSLMVGAVCYVPWKGRMPGMARESLRPQTRETLRRLTFLGVLLDMVPPLLVSLGWLTLVCVFSPPESRTPGMILGMLSLWIVGVLALYAAVMWSLLIRRLSVIFVVLVASYAVGAGVAIGLVAAFHQGNEPGLTPVDLMASAAGLFVVAGLGLAYTWRRWGTVEFGMLDR